MKFLYQTYQNRIIFQRIAILILLLSVNCSVSGQITGDFRTRLAGVWSAANVWERYNGTSWIFDNASIPGNTIGANTITIRNAVTLSSNQVLNINNGAVIRMEGGTITGGNTNTRLNFNAGSICEMIGSTAIPFPSGITTWNVDSTLRLLNPGGNVVYTNQFQIFGNVEYNRPLQNANQTDAFLEAINGNFIVVSTGSAVLVLNNNASARIITIRRDFVLNGGTVQLSGSNTNRVVFIDIGRNIILNGGAINDIITPQSGFQFIGNSVQQNFISSIVLPAAVNQSFFRITSNGPSSINQTYQGSAPQNTIFGVNPVANYTPIQTTTTLLRDITVNNSAGVTLSTAQTINGNVFLTNGALNNSSQVLTMANATAIERTGGSLSTIPTFAGVVDVRYPTHTARVDMGNEIPNVSTTLRNLTITNANGARATKNFTINGVLNLGAINPNPTDLSSVPTFGNLALGTNSLELRGSITRVNGTLDARTGTLVFSGNASPTTQEIPAGTLTAQTIANITVTTNGRPRLNEATNLTDVLTMQGGNLTSNGQLVLKSSASKTAIVAAVAAGATITGDVTVERFIPARRAFRFFSSPVTTTTSIRANWQENGRNDAGFGTHITGEGGAVNGFDATGTNNSSLFTFDNLTNTFNAVTNTNTNIQAGTPYYLLVRGDRTISLLTNTPTPTSTVIRTTGTLFTGARSSSNLTTTVNGFNMFGNPYQAPIDMTQVLAASSTVNSNFLYVWDPTIKTRGDYVTVDLTLGPNGTNNFIGSTANKFIQPGQGFFVQTRTAASPSINFQESHKAISNFNGQVFRTSNIIGENIRLSLFENSGLARNAASDGLIIKFNDTYTDSVDEFDAPKMTNLDEEFAIQKPNNRLSIESRTWPITNTIIPLHIDKYRFTNYTIKADLPSLPKHLDVFLVDKFTGSRTLLTENSTVNYGFSVSSVASRAMNRFELQFQEKPLSNNEIDFSRTTNVYPNPNNGTFYYDLPAGTSVAEASVFNNLGQEIKGFTKLMNSATFEIKLQNGLPSGVYFVRYTVDGKITVKKVIINL